eukprot:401566_1
MSNKTLSIYRKKTKDYSFAFDFQTFSENAVCTEYFIGYGNNMQSSNNNTSIVNNGKSVMDGWNTAYGKATVIPKVNRKYCWAFIINRHHQKYSSICIGIQEKGEDPHVHKDTFFQGQSLIHYGYKSNGKKYSNSIINGSSFSDAYNSKNDIVLMSLDGYTLSFAKLSLDFCKIRKITKVEEYFECGAWIVAEEKVAKNIKYQMIVSLYGKTTLFGSEKQDQSSIELLGYHLVEREAETKIDEPDEDSDDDLQNGEELKKAIISLEQTLASFERTFNHKQILKEYEENADSVHVIQDIKKLQQRVQSCNQHLNEMETYISSLINVNVLEYESWRIPQMIDWISRLEGGKYRKYLKVLKTGFKSDQIDCGTMLCELTAADLASPPFNIRKFMDRKNLSQHFLGLKNEGVTHM